MKWSLILSGSVVILFIFLFDWPLIQKMKKGKKEKLIFLFFLFSGWIFTIILAIYPEMPGPTQWVESLFRPLGQMLEK